MDQLTDNELVRPSIQIKGIREGLLVILGEGDWPEVQLALIDNLDRQAEFLRGARLAIDVGTRELRAAELGQLRSLIFDRDISLWAVLSTSDVTVQTAQTFGLATRINKQRTETIAPQPEKAPVSSEAAILVHRTLRSGASLSHDGHVVVIGDINPGAEVVAGGDIVVWGRLRGMAHAGAAGNEEAVVCALDLSPTQLRIAGQIAVTPQRRGKPQPEMARIQDGQVVAELWDPKKGK